MRFLGSRLLGLFRGHRTIFGLLQNVIPQLEVAILQFRVEVIDSNTGGLLVGIVAARAVLLEERLHVAVERGFERIGGPNRYRQEQGEGCEEESEASHGAFRASGGVRFGGNAILESYPRGGATATTSDRAYRSGPEPGAETAAKEPPPIDDGPDDDSSLPGSFH